MTDDPFDGVAPPKKYRKPRMMSMQKRAEMKAKRDIREAEKLSQKLHLEALNAKTRAKAKVQVLRRVENLDKGKSGIMTPEDIIKAPPIVREHILDRKIIFEPNPGPQTEFLAAMEKEVFYGGARGGGKSFSLLVDPLRYCNRELARALIIRRTMPELRDLINHSQRLYKGAFPGAHWRDQEKEWRFPSGARIEFGYAETRQDALRYQGQSYTWIGVDELPQFPTPEIWNDLRGSLRSVDPLIPEFMRATGNPGNVGSQWVKEAFIDPAPYNTRFQLDVELPNGDIEHITRRFIPAKLTDNPYLTRTTSYMTMLASLPETQRKQWLEGNWDVWDGAAFPEFDRDTHTCKPWEIPKTWIRFRACDWGFSSPAVCLWFAVDYDGTLWVYREFKTKHMNADAFARKIKELEHGDRVQFGVMDSSVWSKRGDIGPSIIETMLKEGVRWRPSDRSPGSRRSGKLEVHRRLTLDEKTKKPTLRIFETCTNLINELPALPLDQNDPEDVDSKANDHSYDALRYGCMSRPLSPSQIDWMRQSAIREEYKPFDTNFGY